jgi:YidC/Oxa1 family membrane protein insertase
MKQDPSSRNTIIFFVCAMVVLLAYETFVMAPAEKRKAEQARQAAALQQKLHPGVALAPGAAPQAQYVPHDKALASSPRVAVDTPLLAGSIALKGGRIDDLKLKGYKADLSPRSPDVQLLSPEGADGAYFTQTGWTAQNASLGLPDANTVWTAQGGVRLTPQSPVTLTYAAPSGLTFTRVIAVDDKYMFTVLDQVANRGAAPVTLAAYGSVQRWCDALDSTHKDWCTDPQARGNAHEGLIGWLGGKLQQTKYGAWAKKSPQPVSTTGGWLGITDKYWMAALAPPQNLPVTATYRVTPAVGYSVFEANFVGPAQTLAPGAQVSAETHVFAGAKAVPLLKSYEQTLHIPEFDQAVDWGLFWFLTRPLFAVLEFFYRLVGNFGVAILLLTVCVRGAFFPISYRATESMTRMKKLQPEVTALKARFEKDPQKMQQETMALYQREKVNPFGGCLPMLLQIPVFFALYKVLSVTIEMRHAPFYGWIHDLSSRDPTTIINLFGAIPWDPSSAPGIIGAVLGTTLHMGVWPMMYMVTMWLSMSMSSTTGMDPTQAQMMKFMPIVFSFFIANVAVGLVIYWCWSNLFTIAQSYVIMHRLKVDNPIDTLLNKISARKAPAT